MQIVLLTFPKGIPPLPLPPAGVLVYFIIIGTGSNGPIYVFILKASGGYKLVR